MTSLEAKVKKVLLGNFPDEKFDFAAILEREDAGRRWDLAVSADWIDEYEFLETVAPKLSKELSDTELINLGRIVILKPMGEFMQEFNQRIVPSQDDRDYFNLTLAGIPMRHAHVFESQESFAVA